MARSPLQPPVPNVPAWGRWTGSHGKRRLVAPIQQWASRFGGRSEVEQSAGCGARRQEQDAPWAAARARFRKDARMGRCSDQLPAEMSWGGSGRASAAAPRAADRAGGARPGSRNRGPAPAGDQPPRPTAPARPRARSPDRAPAGRAATGHGSAPRRLRSPDASRDAGRHSARGRRFAGRVRAAWRSPTLAHQDAAAVGRLADRDLDREGVAQIVDVGDHQQQIDWSCTELIASTRRCRPMSSCVPKPSSRNSVRSCAPARRASIWLSATRSAKLTRNASPPE